LGKRLIRNLIYPEKAAGILRVGAGDKFAPVWHGVTVRIAGGFRKRQAVEVLRLVYKVVLENVI